jgi:translation initiation factor IF-2
MELSVFIGVFLKNKKKYCCSSYGRIKSLTSPSGEPLKEATPGMPVIVVGCKDHSPSPGELLITVADEKLARRISENRIFIASKIGEEDDDEDEDADKDNDDEKALNVVIKADLEGSVEALMGALEALPQDEVRLRFVRTAVGEVSPADVELAKDAGALLVGFNVAVPARVKKLVENLEVELVECDIIYTVLERAKALIEELVDPQEVTTVIGEAEVLQCYPITIGSTKLVVGGSRMKSGALKISDSVRVMRGSETVFDGKLADIRKEKVSVKEVQKNMECGILMQGFNEFKPGDLIQSLSITLEKKKIW